jgi:hypothetical protein
MTRRPAPQFSSFSPSPVGSKVVPLVPVLLGVAALVDLRVDLQLLFDHVTATTLLAAFQNHILAVMVLLLLPSLWHHYRR